MNKNDHKGVPPLLNATSIINEPLVNAMSITNDLKNFNVSNLTKAQHKPLVIHLNAKKVPNATCIMDK